MNKIESTLDGLKQLLEYNLNDLLYSDKYKVVLSRHNNLIGYDVLNRMAIACQNTKAVVLKTEEEWELEGRAIAIGAKPVYVFNPLYDIEYVDTSTGETLVHTDLTAEEKILAMQFGMVEKHSNINEVAVIKTYELYDTCSVNGDEYKVNKPFMSMRELVESFKKVTCARALSTSEETHYNVETNILYVNESESYTKFVYNISLIWAQWLIENRLKKNNGMTYDISIDDFSDKEYELLFNSLTYAISSMFGGKFSIDIRKNKGIQADKIISILCIVDMLMLDVIYGTEFKVDNSKESAIDKAYRLKKTNIILNSMFVAYIQNI